MQTGSIQSRFRRYLHELRESGHTVEGLLEEAELTELRVGGDREIEQALNDPWTRGSWLRRIRTTPRSKRFGKLAEAPVLLKLARES